MIKFHISPLLLVVAFKFTYYPEGLLHNYWGKNCSHLNIPVSLKKLFVKILIDKDELLIKQMWQKSLFFENEAERTFSHGFKACKFQPQQRCNGIWRCFPKMDFQHIV